MCILYFAHRNELGGYEVQLAHGHMTVMSSHFPQSSSQDFVREEDFHLMSQVIHGPTQQVKFKKIVYIAICLTLAILDLTIVQLVNYSILYY